MSDKTDIVEEKRHFKHWKVRMSGTALSFLRHQLEQTGRNISFWRQNLAEAEKAVIKCRGSLDGAMAEKLDLERAVSVLEESS